MRACVSIALAGLIGAAGARAARADFTRTATADPHAGIHHETWVDASIPATIQLVRLDLTDAQLTLSATPQAMRGMTTSAFAAAIGAQVAINGDAFDVDGFVPRGLAVGSGVAWSGTADDTTSAVLEFRPSGARTVAAIVPPAIVVDAQNLPTGTAGVVSGEPELVHEGEIVESYDCGDTVATPCTRTPRSAVAISQDGNTMWLAVADGFQASSLGVTATELAEFMSARGVYEAMALDGGASSTLVLDGAVANNPSDGVERTVANQLAVTFTALPLGAMDGLICKTDAVTCAATKSEWLAGATVTLDDGRVEVTPGGSDAPSYSFPSINPRLACVTVELTGYVPARQCQSVPSGGSALNSVVLVAGTAPIDAGVADAAIYPYDAEQPDAPGHPEPGGMTSGGGCCDAGGQPPPVGLVVLAAWFLVRRRGRTG